MTNRLSGWWGELPEALRWLLFLPAFVLSTAATAVPLLFIIQLANHEIWAPWLSAVSGGATVSYLAHRIAYFLAPRLRVFAMLAAPSPGSLLALAVTINTFIPAALRPDFAAPPPPTHEGIWGIAWLVSAAFAFQHARGKPGTACA